jgi:hypothetical protein
MSEGEPEAAKKIFEGFEIERDFEPAFLTRSRSARPDGCQGEHP